MAKPSAALIREIEKLAKRFDETADALAGDVTITKAAYRIAAARIRQPPDGCMCLDIDPSDTPCIQCEATIAIDEERRHRRRSY